MNKISYTQCKLEKIEKSETAGTFRWIDIAWIPTSLAKIDRNIEIKRGEEWDGPWVVKEKYSSQDYEAIGKNHNAIECFRDKLGY